MHLCVSVHVCIATPHLHVDEAVCVCECVGICVYSGLWATYVPTDVYICVLMCLLCC